MSIFYTILLLLSTNLWATTFKPVGLEEQLKESDGILIGHYLKSKTVKLDSGVIATQMIFKMNKEWGLQSDLFGIDEIIVHFPGGSLGDTHSMVQGVPSFIIGEKVALLTKSVDNRLWGLNLGLGSFKVINYGNETMLINSLFPEDPKLGQVKLSEFEQKVREVKGSNLKAVVMTHFDSSRSPASVLEGKKRSIASKFEHEENKEAKPVLSVYWLVVLLGIAGALSRVMAKRTNHKH